MQQNRSTAVMNRRHQALDSLDDFPTQPWGTRALLRHAAPDIFRHLPLQMVWEPACNRGHMVRPLVERFGEVFASDCHDYGHGFPVHDFLMPYLPQGLCRRPDWIITNPPFVHAQAFVERALDVAMEGVAILARTNWIEGITRYEELFRKRPPIIVAQFTERLPIVRGGIDPDANSATAYAWFIWQHAQDAQTALRWIPPCRDALERTGDYPPDALPPAREVDAEPVAQGGLF